MMKLCSPRDAAASVNVGLAVGIASSTVGMEVTADCTLTECAAPARSSVSQNVNAAFSIVK